jgi:hypothetical protein
MIMKMLITKSATMTKETIIKNNGEWRGSLTEGACVFASVQKTCCRPTASPVN